MLSEFNKFAGFKVLNYFLFNPKIEIHLKGLARYLKISPNTAKHYCDFFVKEGILNVVNKGNLRIFSLDNKSSYVKELKKTIVLLYLKDCGIEKIANKSMSFALYGSYASGEFTDESDLDILIIGDQKDVDKNIILQFEKKIRKEVQLTVISYYKWEEMKKKNDAFATEVLRKHILINGSEL